MQQARDELAAYRDRLAADVVVMGQKLKLPRRMVERNLAQHPELAQVDGVLAQLEQQIAAAP
ncbi:MAG: hypothetical protein ERJ67_05720 [Aphanocapsa feldmannii 277cV]|uniref:Uncharacterized protein n=2 Tax=Aphanocapsa feldmannii TaxID=192050 RepID=A0A524RNI8_9CHRO|nr:MAG: hypothetical protein ERJ69_05810 [Aphanocapsa feldmannii 288cV]TGG92588.1 MAG: hypothetical protein ERJ67_05720 [Aphanocapsa feldmannii 277cV]TGH20008.1 MAG: hypothetical protein ERJ68_07495 [Aphanocapsa feldmannii 277cI]